jgi:hypothetical protein
MSTPDFGGDCAPPPPTAQARIRPVLADPPPGVPGAVHRRARLQLALIMPPHDNQTAALFWAVLAALLILGLVWVVALFWPT